MKTDVHLMDCDISLVRFIFENKEKRFVLNTGISYEGQCQFQVGISSDHHSCMIV